MRHTKTFSHQAVEPTVAHEQVDIDILDYIERLKLQLIAAQPIERAVPDPDTGRGSDWTHYTVLAIFEDTEETYQQNAIDAAMGVVRHTLGKVANEPISGSAFATATLRGILVDLELLKAQV